MTDAQHINAKLSEADVKHLYITPAIEAKWDKKNVRMEQSITAGQVLLDGSTIKRAHPKRADYVLYASPNYPIAVVEAKDATHAPADGIQQAILYAQMLDVPFAYSSNGQCFIEHDFITGKERELSLDEFPSPEELRTRFGSAQNGGEGLFTLQEKVLAQPYYQFLDENPREPRYYQRVAINRTLDRIASGQDRLLLVMATGTGKTYTAFQIVWRLLKSGLKRKILYLADRNVLVDQSIQQDFSPLEKTIHKINLQKDDKTTISAYQVYFSLYQQLIGDGGEERFREWFAPDFFDLIIVDECHRGSAKADSAWRKILEYFSSATQIGMTATPKETEYASNINYFGEPVYVYSLRQGIEDGYLAPFRVINVALNVGQGWAPRPGQLDKHGVAIEQRPYYNPDFDKNIVLEARTQVVAERITQYLKENDRMTKTIVFCETTEAAGRMRQELVNLNADMGENYVVRITGDDKEGKEKLDYFISVAEKLPAIATTSQLLSTGVDCKMVKLIALDKQIGSMTEFKQIIGRGTRLRYDEGKTHFVVMDFKNVTALFTDPDWDGPIQIDEDFISEGAAEKLDSQGKDKEDDPKKLPKGKPIVDADGCEVVIQGEWRYQFDPVTGIRTTESVIDYTKRNMREEFRSLDAFIQRWRDAPKKEEFRELFDAWNVDIDELKAEQGMKELDDFDFLCYAAFDRPPMTRRERAKKVREANFFDRYEQGAREILEALLDKYAEVGVYEIENIKVLKIDPFSQYGGLKQIVGVFGGKENYLRAVRELEQAIYSGEGAQA